MHKFTTEEQGGEKVFKKMPISNLLHETFMLNMRVQIVALASNTVCYNPYIHACNIQYLCVILVNLKLNIMILYMPAVAMTGHDW